MFGIKKRVTHYSTVQQFGCSADHLYCVKLTCNVAESCSTGSDPVDDSITLLKLLHDVEFFTRFSS